MSLVQKQRLLAAAPRPRTVRLSRRGRSWIVLLASVWAAVEAGLLLYLGAHWMRTHSLATVVSSHGMAFYAALFLPFLPVVLSRGWVRQKQLVRDGAVAIATVTTTSNSPAGVNRNDDVRLVQYQFRTDSGALITGSSVDPTFQLRDGSAMLVYYDPAAPTEQVAQCASYYVAVTPGLDPDWLDEIG